MWVSPGARTAAAAAAAAATAAVPPLPLPPLPAPVEPARLTAAAAAGEEPGAKGEVLEMVLLSARCWARRRWLRSACRKSWPETRSTRYAPGI